MPASDSSTRLRSLVFSLGPIVLTILVLLPRASSERAKVAAIRDGLNAKVTDQERRVDNAERVLAEAGGIDKATASLKAFHEKESNKPKKKEPAPVASFESGRATVKFVERNGRESLRFEWSVEMKNTGTGPGRPEMDLDFLDSADYLVDELRVTGGVYEPGEQRVERGTVVIRDVAARDLKSVEVTQRVAQ